jgi:Ca-activated chloride channel homolog
MELELRIDHDAPNRGETLVLRALLRISGRLPEGAEPVPLNLALVLDRSGSMAGEKLEYLRQAATHLIRRLRPGHRVSVVAYDGEVLTLVEGAHGLEGHQGAAAAVQGLTTGGVTNLSGGWLRGRELADRHRSQGSLNRILLMTDGLANQGITEPEALFGLCRSAAGQGISTTTIGFGADFNEDLLRVMAEAGGGSSYYVEDPDQAPGIFGEEVEGLLGVAAQNVAIHVRPGADARFTTLHHAYPMTRTGEGARLDVGDLYAKEPRLALLEFEIPGAEVDRELEIGTLEVRGDVLTAGGGVERREVLLPVRLVLGEGPRVDAEIRRTQLLLESARAREEALEREERGDAQGARAVLNDVAAALWVRLPGDAEARVEADDLLSLASRIHERGRFDAADIKYLKQQALDQRRSRGSVRERYRRGRE